MQDFVYQKNLEHFRKLLAKTTDEAERQLLVKLLEEERSKDKSPAKPSGGQQDA